MREALILVGILLITGCLWDKEYKDIDKALEQQDPKICKRIKDLRMKANCTFELAINTKNVSMCATLEAQNWRDECIIVFAAATNNYDLCQAVSREREKDNCLKRVSLK